MATPSRRASLRRPRVSRTVDLRIEDIAFGGKGVGRHAGKVVFVPYVIDGETVTAEIVREKTQLAEAELVQIGQPSPLRVPPPCPYFGRCGGCAYQHISYEHQLATKHRQVADLLSRIGKLRDLPLRPIVPSPHQYGYRNRVTVHVRAGVIGFFRRDSHELIDVERCPIARDEVNQQLKELRAGNPRDGHRTLRAQSAPRVFSQTNDDVAINLRDWIDHCIPPNQALLIDAFCGAGFFAKALLPKFERVIGIDWDKFATAEASRTATTKETYLAGDVAAELTRLVGRDSVEPTTLIVDPPATGLASATRQAIVDLAPATLLYVSCNPATLARDLKEIAPHFTIESVTPFDMFPQTAEIEVVVHLMRKPAGRSRPATT